MRYGEFRDQLQDALREVGLLGSVHQPIETIDITSAKQRWEVSFGRLAPQSVAPFHISARISFEWDPVNAARGYTCEEDLITELFGRRQGHRKTQPRWTRIDLKLYANLPYGSTTPMPDPQIFGSWTGSVVAKLDESLTEVKERQQRVVAVLGGRGDVEIAAQSNLESILILTGLSVSAFRLVQVPRLWDDPGRRNAEKEAMPELARLAGRFTDSVDEWTQSVTELARWIRYSPPPPGAKPLEPWFENDEEEDGGTGTIH